MSVYLFQISVFHSISYKQSSTSKEIALYLKSLFHSMAFQNVMSLAWNFSLMFDLTSNWKFGLKLKVALSHGRGLFKFAPYTKRTKIASIYFKHRDLSFSTHNLKENIRTTIIISQRGWIMLISFFWQHSLCLLVTYLLFLNICSRSREHSPRLQSGQNFSESWNSGNIFLAQFQENIFPGQILRIFFSHNFPLNRAITLCSTCRFSCFYLNCSSDNLILIHSHMNIL